MCTIVEFLHGPGRVLRSKKAAMSMGLIDWPWVHSSSPRRLNEWMGMRASVGHPTTLPPPGRDRGLLMALGAIGGCPGAWVPGQGERYSTSERVEKGFLIRKYRSPCR